MNPVPMAEMNIVKRGLLHAGLAVAYIAGIVAVLGNVGRFVGEGDTKGMIEPMIFLTLFVVSAAVMGILIFGTPVMLYIDGKKREAVRMLAWTVGTLAVTACGLIGILMLTRLSFD